MQEINMDREVQVLSGLLSETPFEDGYESEAERYFDQLSDQYGTAADTVLLEIYRQNKDNPGLLKHLLFVTGNLPEGRRDPFACILLAGISSPDIEVQDLSVRCIELWEDRRYIPVLMDLYGRTDAEWLREYIHGVTSRLEEG